MPLKNTRGTDINTIKNRGESASLNKRVKIRQKKTFAKRYGIINVMILKKLLRCGKSNSKGKKIRKKIENTRYIKK